MNMEFNEVIKLRRSVRGYDPGKKVTKEQLEEIIRAAQLAPTWKNSQTGRYYVINGEKLEQFRQECLPSFNQNSSSGAALVVTTFVKDLSGFTKGVADNELGNLWGAYDLGLQNAYMVLKATELGLDSLIMGIRDADKIRELLQVPAEEEIVSVIAVGFRAGEPIFRERKPLDEILTFVD